VTRLFFPRPHTDPPGMNRSCNLCLTILHYSAVARRDLRAYPHEAQSDNTDRGDAVVPQHHETVIDLEPSKTFMHHAVSMVDPETKPSGPRQEGSLPTGVLPGFFGFHVEMQEQPLSEFDR